MTTEIVKKTEAAMAPSATESNIEILLRAAIESKLDVASIKELVALKNAEEDRLAKRAFSVAMAEFRAEMPAIRKTVAGQHGVTYAGTRVKGNYAPLDTITPTLDPIAAKHGFWYRFNREVYEGKDYIACIVTHVGGHEERSRFPAPADTGPGRSAIQAVASGESYARRYALTAAFAITCADPDTDGADPSASSNGGGHSPGAITEEQYMNLKALATEVKADPDKFLAFFEIRALADLPASRYKEAIAMMEAKRRQGAKS